MNTEYLQSFEAKLLNELMRLCHSKGMMGTQLLNSDDIDSRWRDLAPEYLADAVKEIAAYPTVSVAWTSYLGMAVACQWDRDWESTAKAPYTSYYGSEGFDNMDEHVLEYEMGLTLDCEDAEKLNEIIRLCGETTVTLIRHEQVEPQSPMAYHIFMRACHCMYRIGASLALTFLGYHFEKVQ
jgi:hypothetical protein